MPARESVLALVRLQGLVRGNAAWMMASTFRLNWRQAEYRNSWAGMGERVISDFRPVLDRGLVGREVELARIVSALETTAAGAGRCVLVSGEAGVGKTRLAQEILTQARRRRVQVVAGRCFEQHTSVPFFPFTEALT